MLKAMQANLYALGAIALWACLASFGVALRHVPPFLLTGLSLMAGSVLAWPFLIRHRRQFKLPRGALALGVFTLFGFHFLLFIGLRIAPAVEVNLVNYLWPLFMVVLAPLYLPDIKTRGVHLVAALLGFAGAAIAILGGRQAAAPLAGSTAWSASLGYLLALGSALIWANYSLQTRRAALTGKNIPAAAIGLFGLVAGMLSLLCHWTLEPQAALSGRDWMLLALMGLGPLGAAFFLWDQALKHGDARQIGILSYITPLGSTALLMLVSGRALTWSTCLAAAMIIGAAMLGARAR